MLVTDEMSGDIFRSVHRDHWPFSSLELEVTETSDLNRLASIAIDAAKSRGAVRVLTPLRDTVWNSGEPSRGSPLPHTFHVWWERSGFWREVHMSPNLDDTTIVVTRDAMLMYVASEQTMYIAERESTTDEDHQTASGIRFQPVEEWVAKSPLLNPPFPADDWNFETLGKDSHLGRVVRRVRAKRRSGAEGRTLGEESGYWLAVNEYECLVDDSLKILLSLVGLVDGAPVADVSVSLLHVDEPIPSETFRFSPPPGAKITRTPWLG